MLTIENHINSDKIEIPDCWAEIQPQQYEAICGIIKKLTDNQIDIESFRIQLALYLMNFESKKWPYQEEKQNVVLENIYRISEKLMFALKPVKDKPNIYDLNLNMGRNLLPVIRINKTLLYGPCFSISKIGILDTDMRAEEFCDAYEYYAAGAINEMICAIYRPDRAHYSNHDNLKSLSLVSSLPENTRMAAVYFFQYVMGYFHASPFYSIIFQNEKQEAPGKLNFGLGGSIYNLAKAGFGSKDEVARLSVTEFFDLLVKQVIDTVKEYHELKTDEVEISKKTGIPMSVIHKII